MYGIIVFIDECRASIPYFGLLFAYYFHQQVNTF